MKEIVVISGKGGTGKTSIAAALACFSRGKGVFADCDVDAADLHLLLRPQVQQQNFFRSGHCAHIRSEECTGCGICIEACRFDAVKRKSHAPEGLFYIDPVACEGCGVCVRACPSQAISFDEEICGEWFISDSRFGPVVHAKLGIAAENSGKLVTLIRNEAKRIAQDLHAEYVLIDGSPGIGCPVIASLTSADLALIVTEPTVSGIHDLKRIVRLTGRLGTAAMVCINKWDINPTASESIRDFSMSQGLQFAGVLRYDKKVTAAQRKSMTLPEFTTEGITDDLQKIWNSVLIALKRRETAPIGSC